MFIPLPREILVPYQLARLIYATIRRRRRSPTSRNQALEQWLAEPEEPLRVHDRRRPHVSLLETALQRKQPVDLQYQGASGPTARTVVPQRLFRKTNHLYLEAFCVERGEQRRFRLDRIKAAGLNPESSSTSRAREIAGAAFALGIVLAVFVSLLLFSPTRRWRAARAVVLPALGIDSW